MRKRFLIILLLLLAPLALKATGQLHDMDVASTHTIQTSDTANAEDPNASTRENPVVRVLFSLIIILIAAKIGGELLERIKQPAVLGELIVGVIIGNLALLGLHTFDYLAEDKVVEILAEIGVILLLFEVGLESNLREMKQVGPSSLFVAILGVIAPFLLGVGVSALFLPQETMYVHIFVGTVLCATSVGITARVLQDLRKINTKEAKVILGAAVFDDILGLIILAVVKGVIVAANAGDAGINIGQLLIVFVKAILFLAGAVLVGLYVSPRLFKIASYLRVRGVLLVLSLLICFTLAYIAEKINLAAIVGAFAAGLIMEDVHYRDFVERGEYDLTDLLAPLTTFLVPIFFVLMGIRVDLATFGDTDILGFALVLTVAAILGKQICSLGVLEKGLDRFSIGVGMIPRGEVGLIVASIGSGLVLFGENVISTSTFSAVVIMVIITTMVTPPVLKITLERGDRIKEKRAATLKAGEKKC